MGSCVFCSLLSLLLLPTAWGDCGPLPNISHAEPPGDTKHQGSFPVGSRVSYSCLQGYVRHPLLSNTIQCLANSQWSSLPEFCGRSCPSPPRVHFARVSQEDEMQNFYPVDTTVKYICRPGYENSTAQLPTSTCHGNLSWSQVPEWCHRKSCGIPANPDHGKVIAGDHLFGAKADVVCDHGYTLKGSSPLIWCSIKGGVVAWSQLPACQAIACPPPPAIRNGRHSGSGPGALGYGSLVRYSCEPGLQLLGQPTLLCTTHNGLDGVWSGAPPECRVSTPAATNPTEPSGEKKAENPYWLASILIPCCIVPPVAFGILAGIIWRWKDNQNHSYSMHLPKQEVKGRDPPMHPELADAEKQQPMPWHSYFCHTTSCHLCPTCEEQLHAALAAPSRPGQHGCATCEEWQSAQPGSPCTYSVPSIGAGERQSPTGISSPATAADVLRGEDTAEAVLEQSKAEQPMEHRSSHHICPVCEGWLRAHLGQGDSSPVGPGEQPKGPCQQDQGPQGPVCPPCTDQLHLSLVHSDVASRPICPLAREGTLAHLVPQHSPSCHLCPICTAPTHSHLCQAPNGRDPESLSAHCIGPGSHRAEAAEVTPAKGKWLLLPSS